MKIFVTGGTGFIGQNLVIRLLNQGHNVIVFGRSFSNVNFDNSKCKYISDDFDNIGNYEEYLKDVDVIFHLLSTSTPKSSNENVEKDLKTNVLNTIKLLELCVKYNVRKFIFTSSGGTVYGVPDTLEPFKENMQTKPICAYGVSKVSIENYIYMYSYLYNMDFQILRISNPYGPSQNPFSQQGAIAVFLGKVLKNEEIQVWGDGSIYRDYIFIDDVVDALYESMYLKDVNNIMNIGSGTKYSLNQIIDEISRVTNKKPNVNYLESRSIDSPGNILDIELAQNKMNWSPKIDLNQGLKLTWNWILSKYSK